MKKLKGLRWWIIGMIGLATVINYIDRSLLPVMWPSISKDLGMTKVQYSIIINVFMVSYAIGQSITGKFFDKIGTRIAYVFTISVWAISSMLHSLARGVLSFSFLRATLGIGQAGNWPGAVKNNKIWFPQNERATAQGIFNAGASIGGVIAPPLIAVIWAAFGWKLTFLICGSFGVIWILPWLIINKANPKKHPWITDKEKEMILENRRIENGVEEGEEEEEKETLSIREILSHKESWAVLIGRFFIEPIWWLFVGWMPIYLAEQYGFNVKQIGLFAWVPYVGAAIGSLTGGIFAGKLIDKGKSVNYARKMAITIGGLIMFSGLISTILFANTALIFVIITAFVLFGFQFTIGNIQTIPSDLFSGESVGSLAGVGGTIGVFSVIIMNFLVPIISKISYTPIFIMIAIFVPLGVLAVYIFARNIRQVA